MVPIQRWRWVMATVVLILAGAALLLSHEQSGPAHPGRALAQAAACSGPAVEREATPVEQELLAALNAHRQARGLGGLVPSPSLMRAARWHATTLVTTTAVPLTAADFDTASHGWVQRLTDCGSPPTTKLGETLGQVPGGADALAMLQLWLDGDANQQLLEDPAYQAVGVAAVEAEGFTLWVLDLAADPL